MIMSELTYYLSFIHFKNMAILIPLFIINFLILGHQIEANIVQSTCKSTPHYQLCVATLSKDPRSSTADVRGLGLIAVDVLKSKTLKVIKQINTLKRSNPGLRSSLKLCSEFYDTVLEADIPEAIEALTKGDPKFAEDGVADTSVEARDCENSLHGKKITALTNMNKDVDDFAIVARAIIRILL